MFLSFEKKRREESPLWYCYIIIEQFVSVTDLDLTFILEISVSGGFGKDLKIYTLSTMSWHKAIKN
jgi:hypothetical protein